MMQAENNRHAENVDKDSRENVFSAPGGGDLANLSDDGVNKGGRSEVVDKVEQREAGLVSPAFD